MVGVKLIHYEKSKKKIAKNNEVICLMLIVGIVWYFSLFMYNDNINKRFESYKPLMFKVEDFEGLICTKHEFLSDKDQMSLAHYIV